MPDNPILILLFSGKRKSGKDYITDNLLKKIGENKAVIIKISGPIKSYWAKTNNLSLEDLLGSDEFKENHRKQMILWSEEIRSRNYGVFCEEAVKMYRANEKPIWIVSDIRRHTDINWFKETYGDKVQTIRIEASNDVRRNRGWNFTAGIDDAPSECDLDNFHDWDLSINNNYSHNVEDILVNILHLIKNELEKNCPAISVSFE